MKQLNFSYNWNNKLRNKCFSTIRIWQPDKYIEGETYAVYLKGKYLGPAKLVAVNDFRLGLMSPGMALLDTGYTRDEVKQIMRKMYDSYIRQHGDNALFGFYIFQYVQPEQKTLA